LSDADRRLTAHLSDGSRVGPYTTRNMLVRIIDSEARIPLTFTGAPQTWNL
jgi:hypothetical protein